PRPLRPLQPPRGARAASRDAGEAGKRCACSYLLKPENRLLSGLHFTPFPGPQGGEKDRYLIQASPTLPDEARAGNVQACRPLLCRRTSSPRRAYIGPGGKGGRWGKPE